MSIPLFFSSHEIEVYALTRSPDHSRMILFFFEVPHPTQEEDRWVTCCKTVHPLSTDQVRAGRRLLVAPQTGGFLITSLVSCFRYVIAILFFGKRMKETRHCTKYHGK